MDDAIWVGSPPMNAAYVCKGCDVEGRDPEVTPWVVLCWSCGGKATITSRMRVIS